MLSEGEVRKVDAEQGKVTLRHGPLTNLDVPAMTMAFTGRVNGSCA
ncbi:copper-binding protein [Variovorax soli]